MRYLHSKTLLQNTAVHAVLLATAVFGCVLTAAAQTDYTFDAPTELGDINSIDPAFPNANAGVFIYIDADPPELPLFKINAGGTWTDVTPTGSGTPNNMSFSGFDISDFTFTNDKITSGVLISDAGGTGAGDNVTTVNGNITLNGSSVAPLSAFAYFGNGNGTGFFAEINAADTTISVTNSGTGGANGLLFFSDSADTTKGADLAGHKINVGTITLTSTNDTADSTSTGFFAGTLRDNSEVTLGDITVNSTGSAHAVSGVTIGGIKDGEDDKASSLTVGSVNVALTTDDIRDGTAARGIYVQNQGSAADVLGTLTVNGDVNVTSKGDKAYARGIEIEGKAEDLIIRHSVTVSDETETDASHAVYVDSGKITVDTNADAALQITASNKSGTQAGIVFSGTETTDTLNISGTYTTFTNNNQAFIVKGADTINLQTNTTLAAGSQLLGVNTLTLEGTTLQIALEKNGVTTIEAGKVVLQDYAEIRFTGEHGTYDKVITVTEDAFGLAEKLEFTQGLKYQKASSANGTDISVTLGQDTLNEFLAGREVSRNTVTTGNLLDSYAAVNSTVLNELGAMSDDDSVLELLQFLTSGGENVVNIGRTALWSPHFRVFNRLYGEVDGSNLRRRNIRYNRQAALNDQYRGQYGDRCGDVYPSGGSGLWMEGYYQDENVTNDTFASRYDSTRWGIMVGKESRITSDSLAGVMFGYGNPKVRNSFADADADDYTVAGYANFRAAANVHGNFFIGYGHQEYKSAASNGGDESVRASFGGNALYTSFELYQPLRLSGNLTLFPLAAFDWQQSWTDSATLFNGSWLEMRLHKQGLEQGVVRTGLNMKWNTTEGVDFRSRVQYGYLVAGDPYASTRASFTGDAGSHQTYRGVNMSRSNFNFGLGMDCTTGTSYKIFVNYDFDYGDKSKRHTSEVGLATMW